MSSLPVRSTKSPRRDPASLSVARDSAASDPQLDLRLGALVVYGGYGLGRVARTRAGGGTVASSSGSVVLEFASSGLSVTLPLERAAVCLRSVADESDLARVRDALRC